MKRQGTHPHLGGRLVARARRAAWCSTSSATKAPDRRAGPTPPAARGDRASRPPPATTAPATAAAATAAKPAAPTGPQVTYAGKVGGGRASIAIAVKDGKAIAYLCDGQTAEAWLQGTAPTARSA